MSAINIPVNKMSQIFCFKSKFRIKPNVGGYKFCRLQCLAAYPTEIEICALTTTGLTG